MRALRRCCTEPPYVLFPFGRQIAGLLLISKFSLFYHHKEIFKSMTWATYFSIGPPANIIPLPACSPRLWAYYTRRGLCAEGDERRDEC